MELNYIFVSKLFKWSLNFLSDLGSYLVVYVCILYKSPNIYFFSRAYSSSSEGTAACRVGNANRTGPGAWSLVPASLRAWSPATATWLPYATIKISLWLDGCTPTCRCSPAGNTRDSCEPDVLALDGNHCVLPWTNMSSRSSMLFILIL
jgi:hypothetical protein